MEFLQLVWAWCTESIWHFFGSLAGLLILIVLTAAVEQVRLFVIGLMVFLLPYGIYCMADEGSFSEYWTFIPVAAAILGFALYAAYVEDAYFSILENIIDGIITFICGMMVVSFIFLILLVPFAFLAADIWDRS